MSHQSFKRIAFYLAALSPFAAACSDIAELTSPGAAGGGAAVAAGGSTSAQTGMGGTVVPTAGGTTPSATSVVGGIASGGGAVTLGGSGFGGASNATGGRATGGVATPSTGGRAKGGAWAGTGGKAAGGATTSTGGSAKGGSSSTGGQSTGGGSSTGDAVKSAGCGKTTTLKGESTKTISVSGTNRSYVIRLPDNYDENHPYRLITSVHCLNGTAAGVASGSAGANYQYYGLWKLAAGSTIFVAPQGINNSWPGGAGDEGFIKALVTEIENTLCIDKSRIFSEGFSMGGSMSYALACAFSDIFRGVVAHSGGPMSGCNKSNRKPVAYFMTHGTKDSVCTYPGYGVPQVNDFAQVNGCQTMDIPNTLKPSDTSGKTPVCDDYKGCSEGYPTRACIFVGDHTPSPGGEANTWVPAETWKFISQF